jgi:hypothetical protein
MSGVLNAATGWLLTGALLVVFGYLAFGHLCCLIRYVVSHKHFSVIPLIGGIAGAIACRYAPNMTLRQSWWVPMIVDFGTLPSLTIWVINFSRRALSREHAE